MIFGYELLISFHLDFALNPVSWIGVRLRGTIGSGILPDLLYVQTEHQRNSN